MQVSHAAASDNYAIVGGGKARDFQIASSAHAFKILSDALYQHKERAVVRETICNAKDAHIASGKPDHPIKLTLTDTEFTIEDSGPGIADCNMVEIYLTYFGSTKTNDDSQIGGFGLGCKAPFCLTEHFMVISRHEGIQSTYVLTAGNDETDGKPSIQLMASLPTKLSGLKVSVPIQRDKRATFQREIMNVLRDGGIKATLNGEEVTEVRDYSGMVETGFGLFPHNGGHSSYDLSIGILYGSVLYPLTKHEQTDPIIRDLHKLIGSTKRQLVLYAPPSSIAVKPDREGMGYNERTLATLNDISRRAINKIKQRLPRARRDLFIEIMQGTPRHLFANKVRTFHLPHREARESATTVEEVVKRVARSEVIDDNGNNRDGAVESFTKFAAKYYRDHAKTMLIAKPGRWNDSDFNASLKRGQYIYTLRKVMRAVMPVAPGEAGSGFAKQFRMGVKYTQADIDALRNAKKDIPAHTNTGSVGPKVNFMGPSATRFVSANRGLVDGLKYGSMDERTSMRLILAPSRIAAEHECGFLVITKDMKPAQVDWIRRNAERMHLKVTVIEPVERKKPVKYKVHAEDAPSEMFVPFMFWRSAPRIKTDYVSRYVASPASLIAPDSFIALALTKRKLEVIHPQKPPVFIGPRQHFDTEFKLHQCVHTGDVQKFTETPILSFENCALPLSVAERDRLVALGVPRMQRKVLDQLKTRINVRSPADAFTAYIASGIAAGTVDRHSGSTQVRFANAMASIGRRLACAVYMQPFKASPEMDETFELWQKAHELFDIRIYSSDWLDGAEHDAFLADKKEFQGLLGLFEKALPRDLAAFFVRMKKGRVTNADVEHLEFLSTVIEIPRRDAWNDATIERLAVLIEQEGRRFLADPKSEKPSPPTPADFEGEDDDE